MKSLEKQPSNYYVYALICPFNMLPFYVGKGKNKGYDAHLKGYDKINKDKVHYIKLIRSLGFEPIVGIMKEGMLENEAYDYENFCHRYIKERPRSFPFITNKTGIKQPPNRLGSKWTEESIQKRSDTVRRKHKNGYKRPSMSIEQRELLSRLNKGKDGPNKVYLDLEMLKDLYLNKNYTKKSLCDHFDCGLGSLNRILKENRILKHIR